MKKSLLVLLTGVMIIVGVTAVSGASARWLFDNAETDKMFPDRWLISQATTKMERTDEFSFEGDYSYKVYYNINKDEQMQWSCIHGDYYYYNRDEELPPAKGWKLRARIFNPNPAIAGKAYVVAVPMDNKERYQWLDPMELGWSGNVDDAEFQGDGWYLYEAVIPEKVGFFTLDNLLIVHFKLHVRYEKGEDDVFEIAEPDEVFGPDRGMNYWYIDDIHLVPIEE
jgi:hypothetical protein